MRRVKNWLACLLLAGAAIALLLTLIPAMDMNTYGAAYRTAELAMLSVHLLVVVPLSIVLLVLSIHFYNRATGRGGR